MNEKVKTPKEMADLIIAYAIVMNGYMQDAVKMGLQVNVNQINCSDRLGHPYQKIEVTVVQKLAST